MEDRSKEDGLSAVAIFNVAYTIAWDLNNLRFVLYSFFNGADHFLKPWDTSDLGFCISAGKSRLYDLSLRRVPVSISTDCMHNIRGLIVKDFLKRKLDPALFSKTEKRLKILPYNLLY